MTNAQASKIAMEALDEVLEKGQPILYQLPSEREAEIVVLNGEVHMREMEETYVCDYEAPIRLHTIGFVKVFGREAMTIALLTFEMIKERYGLQANYMYIFDYQYPNGEKVEFRIKNDEEAIIVYLPCED